MKKIGAVLMAIFIAAGTLSAEAGFQGPEKKNKVTHNKVTKDVSKGAHKTGKGVKHGAYDVSHNKVTKETKINNGNKKYKYQNDM